MRIVLQKFIAQSGYCSRRQAEELIRQKNVLVNDELAELGMKVDEDDEVKVRGKIIAINKEKIYIVLNKPKGYTCTNRQFEGERNVFELVKTKERLFVVGRLDKDSRGLVLLTNDGDLTQKLTHPKFEHEKEYIATITNYQLQITNDEIVRRLRRGVDIGEGDGVVQAKDIKYIGDNKFKIVLTEGKKRQIRRMFGAVGCEIKDLVRVGIGSVRLGNLAEGKYKLINKIII
jgi:23S rRNA pseudouridine2605 synthase